MSLLKFLKRNYKKIIILSILLIIYIYVAAIENMPNYVILFEGEQLKLNTLLGMNVNVENENYKAIVTSSNIKESNLVSKKGQTNLKVSLFNNFTLKNIEVNVIEKSYVIPVGDLVGIKLYAEGVLVVGMSDINGTKPYVNSGIEEGDIITSVNGNKINSIFDLTSNINKDGGKEVKITYLHNGKTKECSITPVKTEENEYKIGIWVRDSAAGIGTITYYDPDSGNFVALGHGITDIDTGKIIEIVSGELVTTRILSIIKGKDGSPGKIQGTIINQQKIGTITKNTEFGIYGKITDLYNLKINLNNKMEVATRNEIKTGKAKLMCQIDNSDIIEEYDIEIQKIYKGNNYDNKSMLIKITDNRLIEKTGGIVQGMSGSPIIQNGKFVGALTHVLINDSTIGYAVFGDILIKQMREVNN